MSSIQTPSNLVYSSNSLITKDIRQSKIHRQFVSLKIEFYTPFIVLNNRRTLHSSEVKWCYKMATLIPTLRNHQMNKI